MEKPYQIGLDSLKATSNDAESSWQSYKDIRLRMDDLFKLKEHAVQLVKEFTALYTNGPAGGGGISIRHKTEIVLGKRLVSRESVIWKTGLEHTNTSESETPQHHYPVAREKIQKIPKENQNNLTMRGDQWKDLSRFHRSPAPSGQRSHSTLLLIAGKAIKETT